MYPEKERVLSLLDAALKEMNLLLEMSKDINIPDDFVSSTPGLIDSLAGRLWYAQFPVSRIWRRGC